MYLVSKIISRIPIQMFTPIVCRQKLASIFLLCHAGSDYTVGPANLQTNLHLHFTMIIFLCIVTALMIFRKLFPMIFWNIYQPHENNSNKSGKQLALGYFPDLREMLFNINFPGRVFPWASCGSSNNVVSDQYLLYQIRGRWVVWTPDPAAVSGICMCGG